MAVSRSARHLPIRQATEADIPAISECARAAYRKYIGRIGREPAPMVADFASLVAQKRVFAAFTDNGDLQGFIVFYAKPGRMHLENVAVSTAWQGRGIGKALIGFCEASARAAGLAIVELYTNEKMTENLVLYPRLGYVETGRRTEDGFNRIYFEKTLF